MRQRAILCMGVLGMFVMGLAPAGSAQAADNAKTAGNAKAGRIKAATCMGCHGIPSYTNVYPTYHVPRLAGQNAKYIVKALEEYKSGKRSFKTMHAQASQLSKQDMKDIAAYLSSLKKGNH